jgi:hypothetical protein
VVELSNALPAAPPATAPMTVPAKPIARIGPAGD